MDTTATATETPVQRLHRLLWEAQDDLPGLQTALEKARADRIERRVEAALDDTGTPQTTEATKEPDEVATLEAALKETKAVVIALGKRHREAVGVALSAELAEKEKARTANWEKKASLESKQAGLFAQLNRLQSEINGLDLAPPRVRNLRTCALSGLAHELKDKLRADPEATLLPGELDKALDMAAQIAPDAGEDSTPCQARRCPSPWPRLCQIRRHDRPPRPVQPRRTCPGRDSPWPSTVRRVCALGACRGDAYRLGRDRLRESPPGPDFPRSPWGEEVVRVPLLAITRDQEWYEAILAVLKDQRLLMQKLLAKQNGEATEKVGDDGNREPV